MDTLFQEKPSVISKILSPNDTGETGSHQAGMLIPKKKEILSFFPSMGTDTKNPRVRLRFTDPSGVEWDFTFIYYNNRFFDGTRNEYRLTGMTSFIRTNNLRAGDTIILQRLEDGRYLIRYERAKSTNKSIGNVLRLGSSWKVIKV